MFHVCCDIFQQTDIKEINSHNSHKAMQTVTIICTIVHRCTIIHRLEYKLKVTIKMAETNQSAEVIEDDSQFFSVILKHGFIFALKDIKRFN